MCVWYCGSAQLQNTPRLQYKASRKRRRFGLVAVLTVPDEARKGIDSGGWVWYQDGSAPPQVLSLPSKSDSLHGA
eukprot:1940692-Rhodomonas_salina.1